MPWVILILLVQKLSGERYKLGANELLLLGRVLESHISLNSFLFDFSVFLAFHYQCHFYCHVSPVR